MEASAFAADKHRGDLRKGTAIPYLSHLWSVAALVMEHGGDDVQVMAALLHDTAEDHGGEAVLTEISSTFGPAVADIVRGLSDSLAADSSQKLDWQPRKEQYLAHLEGADARVKLVSACDKLHNARSILADLRAQGDELWQKFNVKDPAQQLWYYGELVRILQPPAVPARLAAELALTVAEIRMLVAR